MNKSERTLQLTAEEKQEANRAYKRMIKIQQIREFAPHVSFRLANYNSEGHKLDPISEINRFRDLETSLVVNPQELSQCFARIKEMKKQGKKNEEIDDEIREGNTIMRHGAHTHALPDNVIHRMRYTGSIIFACLQNSSGEEMVIGSNCGLHRMPIEDDQFSTLDKVSLALTQGDMSQINPATSIINYRTSIQQDYEGKRIAVALKYIRLLVEEIIAEECKAPSPEMMYLNIAHFCSPEDDTCRIRNERSFRHTQTYHRDNFYYSRHRGTQIFTQEQNSGKRIMHAIARWRCFAVYIDAARKKLEDILLECGYNLTDLQVSAETIASQLLREIRAGNHEL